MTTKILLSKTVFQKLIIHLINIEEEKNFILEDYFPRVSKERREIENLLTNYIAKIDSLIANNVEVVKNSNNSFPFVIIYCEVQVQDVNTYEAHDFYIVPPMRNIGINDVSFLSPVGNSLLLKRVGDEVVIKTPGGKLLYQIKSIKFKPSDQ